MKATEIADLLEKLSPLKYAEEWDNPGFQTGHKDKQINKILVTVDIDEAAINKAIETKTDMIISHHPLIFKGIKSITDESITGKKILKLIENGIVTYSMHTNFDTVGGMGMLAADKLELENTKPLDVTKEGQGIGRIGYIKDSCTMEELYKRIKHVFDLDKLVVYGSIDRKINKVAIVPGSGKEYLLNALEQGADVLITGDVSYHYGLDAISYDMAIIDAGHYGIEHIFIDFMSDYLKSKINMTEIISMNIDNPQKFI